MPMPRNPVSALTRARAGMQPRCKLAAGSRDPAGSALFSRRLDLRQLVMYHLLSFVATCSGEVSGNDAVCVGKKLR